MMRSSWALIIDLGYQIPNATLKSLLNQIWESSELTGPHFELGRFRSLPQASEGQVQIETLAGKCYTKLEADKMGYPNQWPATILLILSLYDFSVAVPSHPELQHFLLQQARQLYAVHPYRMAVLANTSSYYINADFLSTAWLNWQQSHLSHLLLPEQHPLVQHHHLQTDTGLKLLTQQELQQYWTPDTEQTRYSALQKSLQALQPPQGLGLDWE